MPSSNLLDLSRAWFAIQWLLDTTFVQACPLRNTQYSFGLISSNVFYLAFPSNILIPQILTANDLNISDTDEQRMSGLPIEAARLIAFLQRASHARNDGIFLEDSTTEQNEELLKAVTKGTQRAHHTIQCVGAGEADVPAGTRPHRAASALKHFLISRPQPLIGINTCEAVAACAGALCDPSAPIDGGAGQGWYRGIASRM